MSKTWYTLAITPGHLLFARTIASYWFPEESVTESPPLSFPTVMAWKEASKESESVECIGVLGTMLFDGMIVAGPLALAPEIRNRGPMISALLKRYERILYESGVSSYCFYIEEGNAWKDILERSNFDVKFWQCLEGKYYWYIRLLRGGDLWGEVRRNTPNLLSKN